MINASTEPSRFDVQAVARTPWRLVVDTAQESPDDIRVNSRPLDAPAYLVAGHSVAVFEATR